MGRKIGKKASRRMKKIQGWDLGYAVSRGWINHRKKKEIKRYMEGKNENNK